MQIQPQLSRTPDQQNETTRRCHPPNGIQESQENQPTASSNTAKLLVAAAAANNSNEFPPKRPKQEWLAFHKVKHSRVGTKYQVAVLPSIEKKGKDKKKKESSPTQEKQEQKSDAVMEE